MRWFGEDWGAPVCKTSEQADIPEALCAYCGESFTSGSQGVLLPFSGGADDPPELPYHHACLMQSLGIAPVIHILRSGWALCGFSDKFPGEWPEEHKWVAVENRALATCLRCKKIP